MFKFTFYSPVT